MRPVNRYPSVDHLHKEARKRLPKFSYDYVDGGSGAGIGLKRNRKALDAITLTPRYITDWKKVEMGVELFGEKFGRPFGIAPMGLASLQYPRAELAFARAGRKVNIPTSLSTACTVDIEDFGALAGENGWFQLYPPKSQEINDDLIDRAHNSGFKALMVTVDVPARGWRPRDMYNGLALPPRITLESLFNSAIRPRWSFNTLINGMPHFKTLGRYSKNKSMRGMAEFVGEQLGQMVTSDRLKRIRDHWKGPLIIKGVMHPDDAKQAMKIGYDGILVSNHGGRQMDASPAPVEVLPDIVEAVGGKVTVMVDSGFSSGLDIVRGLALGAQFVFCGRAFMWGLSALGEKGVDHVVDLLTDEITLALTQIGCPDIAKLNASWLKSQ
ncbi:MAG: alpha-hydroxy-acid oxidizing protein [Rhodospirillaceae bacterium]|nr:alpha-hydroxy-acid oxidizing protein [Rhodospirillaceae bacterium]